MIVCLNCNTKNGDGIVHCRECGANLRTKKYQRQQDPVDESNKRLDKLERLFGKLVEALEKEHEEEPIESNAGGPEAREPDNKPTKRKRFPIF